MNRKVIVHEAQEGGYWAEVSSIAGCAIQGETLEELMANLQGDFRERICRRVGAN